MANHEVRDGFPAGGSTSANNIQEKLAAGLAWTPASAAVVNDTDLTGLTPRVVLLNGTIFEYDSESMAAHDGVSVLVSDDGKRFIATELRPGQFVNVAAIRNAPLGSEVAGDRLIVGASPTGDFAGHAHELTVKNGAGDWIFVEPQVGQEVYVEAAEGKYHYNTGGEFVEGAAGIAAPDGSIGARSLEFPFGNVVEDELEKPPADLIAQNDGTAEGDLTGAGGLAALFDTTESQAGAASAQKTSTTSGFGGKEFSADKRIEYAAFIPSNNLGFAGGGATNVTLELYGWDDPSAPTDDADLAANGTLLGTLGPFLDNAAPTQTRFVGSDDRDTEWPRAYGRVVRGSSGTIYLAELKFYEPADLTPGFKWIVAANAIGVWEGHDADIAEAIGAAGFFFHEPYEGARLVDKGDGNALKKFSGGEWVNEGGTYDVYDASDTWTKPDFGTFASFLCWGGGGGGASVAGAGGNASGGGGGGFVFATIPLQLLPSSLLITVGNGGAAVSGNGQGNAGSATTISSGGLVLVRAGGGGGGRAAANTTVGGGGGGGGGDGGNGADSVAGAAGAHAGAAGIGGVGGTVPGTPAGAGWQSGGGGGGGVLTGTSCTAGANASIGGAGGGATVNAGGASSLGGTSFLGGNGGAGLASAGIGADGSVPSGGGGAGTSGGGAGGKGRVIVIIH